VKNFLNFLVILLSARTTFAETGANIRKMSTATSNVVEKGYDQIVIAGGCFWCIEGAFSPLRGIKSAISGYIGGKNANPTYEQVCSGTTQHAEAVRVVFDQSIFPLEKVLKLFFGIHDPTTLNYQGNDHGTQYRSAIFYYSPQQLEAVQKYIAEIAPKHSNPIVTEIQDGNKWPFYEAESYHQNYYEKNPNQGYCRAVVRNKVEKAKKLDEML
jgi:methionine-S-sulfoxide reductase